MQLRLVNADAAILRRKAIPCTKTNVPPGLEGAMIEFAASMNALGLAAPQVDYGLRLIVVRNPWRKYPDGHYLVMRNPRIVKLSRGREIARERCLSLRGVEYDVPRALGVQLEWDGGSSYFTDMDARVIQHEIDHLDGILISDRGTKVEVNNG